MKEPRIVTTRLYPPTGEPWRPTPVEYVDRDVLRERYALRPEDSRFTVDDAKRELAAMRRGEAIARQTRKMMVTLAPGERPPRERIAYLEAQLAKTEAERVELAKRVLNCCGLDDEDSV